MIASVTAGLLNVVMVLLVSPFLHGLQRKIVARIQARQGPPLWQPYYDLLKLAGKEDIEVGEVPAMQRFAAYLALAVVLTIAFVLPMGTAAPGASIGDAIMLVYLLTLMGICTILAGLAAGSTYSLVGISREMMSMVTLEPLFAVAVLIAGLHVGSLHLDLVLKGGVYAVAGIPWSGLAMLALMLLAFQAFVQRIPFDTSEAETELIEGPLMEYSGPKLALFKYAQMAKLVVFAALFIGLFAPWSGTSNLLIAWLVFWLKVVVLMLFVTAIAALHARYRIDQAIRYFVVMDIASLGALVVAAYGH
ncbi:MAG TPA: complex I subunit 1 family protein [Terriglobales bacterium]|nr:complex I subunit 1 family protein [Terriglobales bacterium]